MDDRTLLTVGAAAIALFGVGTIGVLWTTGGTSRTLRSSADASVRDGGAGEGAAAAPVAPPGPVGAVLARDGASSAGGASAVPAPPDPAPEDVDPSWRDSRIASRLRELGPVAPYVIAGLKNAREEMNHCFEAHAATHAGPAATEPHPVGSPAVLVLYLEAREGQIDVVDVRIHDLGTSSGELVACCREVLRGHEIPVPIAVPGRRYRLNYTLQ